MKFTLAWLKEYLDTDASVEKICETLNSIGLEVEEVEDPASMFAPFHSAKVVSAEKHPDADKLKLCVVDTGSEKIQVVCGAPNAKSGMIGIFAPEGSYIPGTDMVLKKGVIRGVESCGMLVSEREMGLSDSHEGIIELPADTPIGKKFSDIFDLNDPVIDIAVTPNRADCTGIYGIARDLAAAGLGKLKPIAIENKFSADVKSPIDVSIDTETNPLFVGKYVKGVKNCESPDWLKRRLKAVGLRPISALVDITNYICIAYGRPLHIYDASKIKGNLVVRLSKNGETLDALNDKDIEIGQGHTVICDDDGVLALGGVIGGRRSGAELDTTEIFIESAYFMPEAIAKTGRALQTESDARYRFERGIDPEFTVQGAELAAMMVEQICGGKSSQTAIFGKIPQTKRVYDYSPSYCKKLSGLDISVEEQKAILKSLGFDIDDKTRDEWQVTPPSWRGDIQGKADIVEEIIRIHGFEHLPHISVRNEQPITASAETKNLMLLRLSRHALTARGMNECITWSFCEEKSALLFGSDEQKIKGELRISNPINSELSVMRPCALPNLIKAAIENSDKGMSDLSLFEVGAGFVSSDVESGQKHIACGVRYGKIGNRHWEGSHAFREYDIYDVKADALAVLEACNAPVANLQVTREDSNIYHPGRYANLRLGKNILARFGEIHPSVADELDVSGRIYAFEVFLDNIPESRKKTTAKPFPDIPSLQAVNRDFAFVVDKNVEAESIVKAIYSTDKKLIGRVDVFDVYSGKNIDDNKKSVAVSVTIQPREATLTDSDLDSISRKISDSVATRTGGVLRT